MADWQSALNVISTALGVISTATSAPGINLIPYVSTIAAAANAINIGLKTAVNVAPYIKAISDTFSGGLPTQEQRIALDLKIAELEAQLHAPLPPKEEGEED